MSEAMTNIEHLRRMKKKWYQIMAHHPTLQDTPFLNAIDSACNEIEQHRTAIAGAIEAIERGSTSAPVLECLKAAVTAGQRSEK